MEIEELENKLKENPNDESSIDYDRKWWHNYLGEDFRKERKTYYLEIHEDQETELRHEFNFGYNPKSKAASKTQVPKNTANHSPKNTTNEKKPWWKFWK